MQFPITGDSTSWLDFWGSYIGAVLRLPYTYSINKTSKIILKTLQTEIFNFL